MTNETTDTEFHLCEVVVRWEEGMSTDNIDERKCPNEAVAKYEYETEHHGIEENWLCEQHKEQFRVVSELRSINTSGD